MTVRDLQHLLDPRRVVLVAARPPVPRWAAVVAANLQGFAGAADGPFLAVVCLPQPDLGEVLRRLAGDGCRAAVLIGGGTGPFTLSGNEVAGAHASARGCGIRLIGPTRVGVIVPRCGLRAGSTTLAPRDGRLAFVTQSDSMATSVVDWAQTRSIGFSAVVATGDSPDGELGDVLDALAQDPATRAVLLHLNGIGDARRFLSAARAAARTKPLVVLKAHGPDAEHEAVYDAAFERAGALRVADMRELFTAAGALAGASAARVARGRLAILANGSALGLQAADALLGRGGTHAVLGADTLRALAEALGSVPHVEPPMDLGLEADPEAFATAARLLLEAPGADAVLACLAPGGRVPPDAFAQALIGLDRKRRPLLVAWMGGAETRAARERLAAAGIPSYATPEEAAAAFMFKVAHERQQRLLTEIPSGRSADGSIDVAGAAAAVARRDSLSLLRAYGFEVDPTAPHGPVELHLAIRTDATFGPNLVIGLGGPGRRRIGTPAVALPPLSEPLARATLARTVIGRLILESNHATLPDAAAVVAAMIRLGEIAVGQPEIVELDIDPLLVRDGRLVVAGASMVAVPVDPAADATSRLAIGAYPVEMEETVRLRDGSVIRLRPVRPDDAASMIRLFHLLDPEDRRLRLFALVKELSPELAARLTQIDYDRELALVAEPADSPGDLLAGARVISDPDGATAEFAITVRSDQKRRGLGRICLGRVIGHARRRGVREIWGEILGENRGMLALAGNLGFALRREPDEPEIIRATLRLEAAPG